MPEKVNFQLRSNATNDSHFFFCRFSFSFVLLFSVHSFFFDVCFMFSTYFFPLINYELFSLPTASAFCLHRKIEKKKKKRGKQMLIALRFKRIEDEIEKKKTKSVQTWGEWNWNTHTFKAKISSNFCTAKNTSRSDNDVHKSWWWRRWSQWRQWQHRKKRKIRIVYTHLPVSLQSTNRFYSLWKRTQKMPEPKEEEEEEVEKEIELEIVCN